MNRACIMIFLFCLLSCSGGYSQNFIPPGPALGALLPFGPSEEVKRMARPDAKSVTLFDLGETEVKLARYNVQDLFSEWALIREKGEEWEMVSLFGGLTDRYVTVLEWIDVNGKGKPEIVLGWEAMDGWVEKNSSVFYREEGIQIWEVDELNCLISLSTDAFEERTSHHPELTGERDCYTHQYKSHVFPGGFFLHGYATDCDKGTQHLGSFTYLYSPEGWEKVPAVATFFADTTKLMQRHSHDPRQFEEIKEMRWVINGIPFTWGTQPVEVEVNPFQFDTLLFQRDSASKWDTILCNITKPNTYLFEYNECCGAFNVRNQATNRFPLGAAEFVQMGTSENKLLGIQGEGAIFLAEKEYLAAPRKCMPAMGSNVEWIQVVEVEEANSLNCKGVPGPNCIFTSEGKPLEEECFNLVKTRIQFLYLFLEAEPLVIHCTKGSVKLKLRKN